MLWILLFSESNQNGKVSIYLTYRHAVTLVSALDHLGQLRPGLAVFDPSLAGWIMAFTVLSLLVQIGATSLIAWRIFGSIKWSNPQWWTREWHALRIVVESGAIYGILTILSLVSFVLRMNFGTVVVDILVQMSVRTPYRAV